MKKTQIVGIVALVAAGVAGYMGYAESQGLASSLTSAIQGQPSDTVMIKYGLSIILVVVGIITLKK